MGAASTIAVRAVWLLQFKTITQKKGQNVLCMLPDTGERYLGTPLFAEVSADMNEEEFQISRLCI